MKRVALLATALAAGGLLLPSAGAETSSPPAAPPVYQQTLRPQGVRQVQQRLRELGFYRGQVDGVWGAATEGALERFQSNRQLQVTGQLNPATVASMGLKPDEILASGTRSPAEGGAEAAGQPLTPQVVKTIQQRLQQAGFSPGGADGVWGPGTEDAIKRFQQNRGLQATGQLNPTTIAALGLDPNNLQAAGNAAPDTARSGSTVPERRQTGSLNRAQTR